MTIFLIILTILIVLSIISIIEIDMPNWLEYLTIYSALTYSVIIGIVAVFFGIVWSWFIIPAGLVFAYFATHDH